MSERALVSIVIPAFNEGDAVLGALKSLERIFAANDAYRWEIVLVNDGSSDDTLAHARSFCSEHAALVLVDLSRNFGKEAALSAGLELAAGDAVIPMDADLQDPPELIPRMLALWAEGAEVVLARRSDRTSDSWLKRVSAARFYRVMNSISEVAIPENVGDFRLMDRAVVDVVRSLPENRRFMKGLFAWAGFRTSVLDYVRPERATGQSRFNALSLLNLAVEGFTSFSSVPLRLATLVGGLTALAAFAYGGFIVLRTLLFGVDLPGYASMISVMLFLSGMQLLALGVIGEYVGRTYLEAKRRPAYVVRKVWRSSPTRLG